jgi:hypothetical protein
MAPVLASEEMQADPCPGDNDADANGSALHDVRQHPAARSQAAGPADRDDLQGDPGRQHAQVADDRQVG